MSTPEQKLALIRQQVIAKMQWETSEDEVRQWLGEKHGIVDDDASRLISEALTGRTRVIRQRAMTRMVGSGIGIAVLVVYFIVQYTGKNAVMDWPVYVLCATVIACLIIFVHSMFEVVSGKHTGPIE